MNLEDIKKYPFETSMDPSGVDPYYVVRFKDFDNVVGTGDSIEEAISDAFEVLEEEIEYRLENGISIPAPSLPRLDDVSGRITLRMPKSLHRKLIVYAEEEGVSLNSAINTILVEHVNSSSTHDYLSKMLRMTRFTSSLYQKWSSVFFDFRMDEVESEETLSDAAERMPVRPCGEQIVQA